MVKKGKKSKPIMNNMYDLNYNLRTEFFYNDKKCYFKRHIDNSTGILTITPEYLYPKFYITSTENKEHATYKFEIKTDELKMVKLCYDLDDALTSIHKIVVNSKKKKKGKSYFEEYKTIYDSMILSNTPLINLNSIFKNRF